KILCDSRLRSKFAKCIATEHKQIDPLFEILSEYDQQWDGSPFREFKICTIRKIQKGRNQETWPCTFEVQFKNDGQIGSWNVTTNEKNILDINMSCLDAVYSWKLNIKTTKFLPNDKFTAQGAFVYKLRINPENRLVYSNTEEINVVSICEKTRWKYWWGTNYIIEITKYEFWELSKYMDDLPGVEIPLNQEPPFSVTFGVS
ncbi:7380_t:CDS:2, partial [Funneliformis mosseae]